MRYIVIALLIVAHYQVLATNGTNIIGLSPVSRAMGGTGVAHFSNGADSLYKNPATLSGLPESSQWSIEFHSTLIKAPTTANAGLGEKKSQSGPQYVPDLATTYRASEKLSFAGGILSYAGAAFDHTGQVELVQLKTDYDLARIQVGASYQLTDQLSIGLAPFLGFGQLALNESIPLLPANAATTPQTGRKPHADVGLGAQLGLFYQLAENLNVGLSYITEIGYRYKDIVNLDLLGPNSSGDTAVDDLNLEQPQEIALGAKWSASETCFVQLDLRAILWSSADLFKQLGWKNQYVVALGGQYQLDEIALRLGFNYGNSPVDSVSGENGAAVSTIQGHQVFAQSTSMLNVIGFPPFLQSHITAGAGYGLNEKIDLGIALLYAPSVTRTRAGTGPLATYSFTSKISSWAITLGITAEI